MKRNDVLIFISGMTVSFMATFTLLTYTSFDLSNKNKILNANNRGILLLDSRNRPFFNFYGAKYQSYTSLSQIPSNIKFALIAMEDKNFYRHGAFSVAGIMRSIILNLKTRSLSYGGSTLTQQLIKNSFLGPSKNLFRKYQEILLAVKMETLYTKDEILEMYLNTVYFGRNSYGVGQAAQNYFNKNPKNLSLSESAFLVGILPAPSTLADLDIETGRIRQKLVLEAMFKQHYVLAVEKLKAEQQRLILKPDYSDINKFAPHFSLMVKDRLIKMFGSEEELKNSGLRVRTTLDLDWQKYAEESLRKRLKDLLPDNASDAATVVINPKTSEVKVLVGSYDWFDEKVGKINMANSPRSTGSAFKPIIYATAFEQGIITPVTMFRDLPTKFAGGYSPVNYDRKFRGPVSVRRALANSLNVPSVELMSKVGIDEGVIMAKRLGLKSLKEPQSYGLSLVLGTGEVTLLELTNAYAAFADNGIYKEPIFILDIADKFGRKIYSAVWEPVQVLKPSTTFLISSILSDKIARLEEFGRLLDTSNNAAVKTGTSEDYRDAWTVGYTPNLTVGVWVGNPDNRTMSRIAGSIGAAPIWKDLIENFSAQLPNESFRQPGEIITANCRFITPKPKDGQEKEAITSSYTIQEYFLKGTISGNCL